MAPTSVVAAVVLGLLVPGCGSEQEGEAGPAGTVAQGHGLSVKLPPGWYGDVTKPEPGAAPLLRAATFPLREAATDLGQRAQRTMGVGDILVSVADYGCVTDVASTDLPVATAPIAVSRADVSSFEGFLEPVVTRSFVLNGEALQLWVVFGGRGPTDELLDRADQVLATLDAGRR